MFFRINVLWLLNVTTIFLWKWEIIILDISFLHIINLFLLFYSDFKILLLCKRVWSNNFLQWKVKYVAKNRYQKIRIHKPVHWIDVKICWSNDVSNEVSDKHLRGCHVSKQRTDIGVTHNRSVSTIAFCFLFFNRSFIEIKFTYHTIYPFEMYNSVVLNIFTTINFRTLSSFPKATLYWLGVTFHSPT